MYCKPKVDQENSMLKDRHSEESRDVVDEHIYRNLRVHAGRDSSHTLSLQEDIF
jgi:hypothetical protein